MESITSPRNLLAPFRVEAKKNGQITDISQRVARNQRADNVIVSRADHSHAHVHLHPIEQYRHSHGASHYRMAQVAAENGKAVHATLDMLVK